MFPRPHRAWGDPRTELVKPDGIDPGSGGWSGEEGGRRCGRGAGERCWGEAFEGAMGTGEGRTGGAHGSRLGCPAVTVVVFLGPQPAHDCSPMVAPPLWYAPP